MKTRLAALSFVLLSITQAHAQQPQPTTTQDAITVTTTVEPLPLSENDRAVNLIDARDQPLLVNNLTDLLRLDPSVNLQARAGNGVQADLSMRGTTFEQSLVLLNGLHINDSQTGHFNLEIPVPLEAVSRIDVLHGSGSTFYGSDAIGGAVNLITQRPTTTDIIAKTGFGNYGSEEQHLRADLTTTHLAEQLSGSRDTSDGFIPDRGYHANALASETWLTTRPGTTDILLAASDRPYGADQFYGDFDSWERTKAWFASIQQQLGPRTAASFGYQRHTDLFVLLLDNPDFYRNNHITTSYEGALRRADTLGSNATLSYGLEEAGDTIDSSNLGHHARNQGAGYATLSLRALGRFSLSLGGREEVLSGNGSVFSPNLAAAFALTSTVRLRGSVGHGFRLPTYTDLYYADPATLGNPALKPESSWSYEAGLDWNPGGPLSLTATAFRLNQKDAIDYSKYSLAAPWQATNVQGLNLTGAETALRLRLSGTQQLQLSYTAVHAGPPPAGLISEYAYNYAAQSALAGWTGELFHQVSAHTQVAVIQKTTHTAYPLWDVSVARSHGHIRPYLRLLNLSNTGYQEIPGVPLQGRTLMAGTEINWSSSRH
ncbi:TonB-dependent receptor plug domain-containing protein [Granulicella arctica]|uniref:Iron complex outermembrane receptor protein n=1 Tax=Granulicella arctica TaxID=940613 RepID=A0A7Y9TRJ6_9BACT|nr:TonB-dependent receptor [Granulicella arctica]NYF78268.1 iron complex outermembrane receptor protein [Granulicella arctica]